MWENIVTKIGSNLRIEITDEYYESIKNLTLAEIVDIFQVVDTE